MQNLGTLNRLFIFRGYFEIEIPREDPNRVSNMGVP